METVFDVGRDRYLVIYLGWDGHCRVYNCVIHLDLKDGKIRIQRNQTDSLIANELVDMGVVKEDIILGLQPAYTREYTGVGVA